jgi:hypothetical protein
MNVFVSLLISMVKPFLFFTILPIALMSGGPILSLLYKEYTHKNEYFFYYNRSISKINLIFSSIFFSVLLGVLVQFMLCYVRP